VPGSSNIADALASVVSHLTEHPEDGLSTDSEARASVQGDLRVIVQGPDGTTLVTDMPAAVGGGGSAPTPGWILRAALASCDATLIAMSAARERLRLDRIEVSVTSRSDDRGLVGAAEGVPAGPLEITTRVRLEAPGADPEVLARALDWAREHSPVDDALRRAVPVEVVVET